MISRALVVYIDMRIFIGRILDDVQAPYVSSNNSIGTITSYFHKSLTVHPGSNDHLQIRNLIHGNMLSLSSKKQRNGKVSLKTGIIGVYYMMTITMLMEYSYIVVRYFYIINQLILRDISRVIYKPTKSMKSNYFS